MTTITFGGKTYQTSPMNFKRVKKAWPLIVAASIADDPMDNMEQGIALVALALEENHPDVTADFIENTILSTEIGCLKAAVEGILKENDLMPDKANGTVKSGKGEGAAPSTEISTSTSPNSSQPVAAEVTG